MKKLIGVAALMALAGCSTNPTSAENADQVPVSRIFYSGTGVSGIQITRDGGALGSGCYIGVFLDGKLVARIGGGETVKLSVPAGEHLVGMGDDPHGNGLCAIGGVAMREVPASLSAGQNRRFRIFGDMNGFQISPTSF
ncbi:TPA: hypothetical protein N2A81_005976 [Pseudomonas aeruginosa]|nr:hypothetical protein [Pseudomonas aeruginosa]